MMPETAYIGLDNNPIDKADAPLIYAAISAKSSDYGQVEKTILTLPNWKLSPQPSCTPPLVALKSWAAALGAAAH
jgi:hypothetical protein